MTYITAKSFSNVERGVRKGKCLLCVGGCPREALAESLPVRLKEPSGKLGWMNWSGDALVRRLATVTDITTLNHLLAAATR